MSQAMPQEVLEEAERRSRQADLFLSIGSSPVVYPAAGLPRVAKAAGARLAILNRDPTPLDDLADARVAAPIGEAYAGIDALVSTPER